MILARPGQIVASGQAWYRPTELGAGAYHLHGRSSVVFDLADKELEPGVYRIGMIARTGTRYDDATDQVQQYRLHLDSGDDQRRELGRPEYPVPGRYAPVRAAGEPGSWGDWYGSVHLRQATVLGGGKTIVVENLAHHGGVMAVWLQKAESYDAAALTIETEAPGNAFHPGQTPQVTLRLELPAQAQAVEGFVRLEQFDLLTEETQARYVPFRLQPGATALHRETYPALAGVFRVTGTIVARAAPDAPGAEVSASCTYAFSPAARTRDLPDDWPLASHVDRRIPPQPGFRWYRYFASWAKNNPAPGEYDWAEFDDVFRQVQAAGGKLMVAYDGSPVWSSARGKAGMGWSEKATAYPPDDWQVLEDYLRAMVRRYGDEAGTLAALELCNEANTEERWLGTADQLVESARVFRRVADTAAHGVKVVGISVSAGHQEAYVRSVVEAGLLEHVDAVSGHWYEELMSYEAGTPINNLLRHVDLLRIPMKEAGHDLPLLNTECGVSFAAREGGRLVSQATLNARNETPAPPFPGERWLDAARQWRVVSERRAAATYVAGTVMLMAHGVRQSYYFSHLGFVVENAPSLPWVALGRLGYHLQGVDYHRIEPLAARFRGSDGADGSPRALAYLIGAPGGRRIIVAWGFLSDTSMGRSKHWQRWLEPGEVEITTDLAAADYSDLYGRASLRVVNDGGTLVVPCGEEPVFLVVRD